MALIDDYPAAHVPADHPLLRHTLAIQAINRGISLETIADIMDMTLRYAKIANRTVADE